MNDRRAVVDRDVAAYEQLAVVLAALSSPLRLELIESLAQCERTVEQLAGVCALPVKTVSHHLRKLLAAGFVRRTARGREAIYSLRDESVAVFWAHLRAFAAAARAPGPSSRAEAIETATVQDLVRAGKATLLDVRPDIEHAAGHVPGAHSIPLPDLEFRLDELPRDRLVVAICRGVYCRLADAAVTMLRARGYEAVRYAAGMAEWRAAGGEVVATRKENP